MSQTPRPETGAVEASALFCWRHHGRGARRGGRLAAFHTVCRRRTALPNPNSQEPPRARGRLRA
jgi:hypothetical protein